MKKKIIERIWKFIYDMENERPFYSELSKDMWLGNFSVPLFYSYLKYCQNSGEDISDDEIVDETISMIAEHYDKHQIKILTLKLYSLVNEYDKAIFSIQEAVKDVEEIKGNFNFIYITYLFTLFGVESEPENAFKVDKILIELSDKYDADNDSFKLSGEQIARWVKPFILDMQKIVLKFGSGKFKKDDLEVENILIGFATYMATMHALLNVPVDLATSAGNQRNYITMDALYESLKINCSNDKYLAWCNVGLRVAYQFNETNKDISKNCINLLLGILKDEGNKETLIKILKAMLQCIEGYTFLIEKDKSSGKYRFGTNISVELAMLLSQL